MITLSVVGNELVAGVTGNDTEDFQRSVAGLKYKKFRYNVDDRTWRMNIAMVTDDLYNSLMLFTPKVYYPDYTRQIVENYTKNLPSELKVNPIDAGSVKWEDYVNFPPFKGKSPYENYQFEDITKAISQNRFLFNWEMGLGKSYATAFVYGFLNKNKGCSKMILFTSKIGTYNLASEMEKFCKDFKEEDVAVFSSAKSYDKLKKGLPKELKPLHRKIFDLPEVCNKRIIVFAYDAWKVMAAAYGDKTRSKKKNVPLQNFFGDSVPLVCFDECQKLANPKSDRSKYIFKYLPNFPYRYEFSATPADKPEKLYSIGLVLDPCLIEYLKYDDWLNKHNDIGTYYSKYAINKARWHMDLIDKLNQNLLKYSAKRNAKDCLDLPPLKLMKPIMIDMDEKQTIIYRTAVNEIINAAIQSGKDGYGLADVVRDNFTSIQTLLENPNVAGPESNNKAFSDKVKALCGEYDYAKHFAKLEVVDDILEEEFESDRRGIIWYIHPKTLDALKERYAKLNPICITADCGDAERDALIEKFKKDKKHKILIASINIMNTSVTVNEATFAVYLENTYSYENYFQSMGRIYRIGQKEEVHIWHTYYKGTTNIYSKITLDKKQDLVKSLFSDQQISLDLNQIRAIFLGEAD